MEEAQILEKLTKEPIPVTIEGYSSPRELFLCRVGYFDMMVVNTLVGSMLNKLDAFGLSGEDESKFTLGIVRMRAELCFAIKAFNPITKECSLCEFASLEDITKKVNINETIRLHKLYRESYVMTEIQKKS